MTRRSLVALVTPLVLCLAADARAASIFDGDPIDTATGRAHAILPGVPLILPQADGRYRPPIVDPGVVGDVDLVVRAAHVGIGPVMPPPVAVPPVAIAGGSHVTAGSAIPFTVIASDGSAGLGVPLGGSTLDGIPVVVAAWADLDGDGLVGPTSTDASGAADNGREREEANFLVGRQVAVFAGGIAQGTLVVRKGAPASAGGLTVVLTAVAYVGPFRPDYFDGDLPDGPGVATLLPFFPRLDPDRVFGGNGGGGPADPDGRLEEVELAPAFEIPVGDPTLGTPFALPTNGSNGTLDRARVHSGPLSRFRFVRPSDAAAFPDLDPEVEAPLFPGAAGALFEALPTVSVADDGPGNPVQVRLVPVDVLDNITDPPTTATALLVAGPGLAITAPNSDGDPARETVVVGTAAGVVLTLDDTGGAGGAPTGTTLRVTVDGFTTEVLAVALTPGGGPTTTTVTTTTATTTTATTSSTTTTTATTTTTTTTIITTTTTSSTTTTVVSPGAPSIAAMAVTGMEAFALDCPVARTLAAVVDDPDGDPVAVTATLALDGTVVQTLSLAPGSAPPGTSLPPGPVYTASFVLDATAPGTLVITVQARDAGGATAVPLTRAFPVQTDGPPVVTDVVLTPDTVTAAPRASVVVSARGADDCGLRAVSIEMDAGAGFESVSRMGDGGRQGDESANDGVFTREIRFRAATPGTILVRVKAVDRRRQVAVSEAVALQVVAP